MIKTNPADIITNLSQFGKYISANRSKIDNQIFADKFGKVERVYYKNHQRDIFCQEADELADKYTAEQELDFAGIIMSRLCWLNEFIPENLEYFASKSYNISKLRGDFIHMMARLNSLRKIYDGDKNRLFDYIQVLYKQEKCLKQITNHYEESVSSFRTVNRQTATKQSYERMLAHIQLEIAKLTKRKHPIDARNKILSAMQIFEREKNNSAINYAKKLLHDIDTDLQRKNFSN